MTGRFAPIRVSPHWAILAFINSKSCSDCALNFKGAQHGPYLCTFNIDKQVDLLVVDWREITRLGKKREPRKIVVRRRVACNPGESLKMNDPCQKMNPQTSEDS